MKRQYQPQHLAARTERVKHIWVEEALERERAKHKQPSLLQKRINTLIPYVIGFSEAMWIHRWGLMFMSIITAIVIYAIFAPALQAWFPKEN